MMAEKRRSTGITAIREVAREDPGPTLDQVFSDAKELEDLLSGGAEEEVVEEVVEAEPEAELEEEVVEPVEEVVEEVEAVEEEPEEEVVEEVEKEGEEEYETVTMRAPAEEGEEGEIPLELEVEDAETAQALGRLQAKADSFDDLEGRAEEIRDQMFAIEDERAKVNFVLDSFATDPSGFLLERVQDTKLRQEIVVNALFDDDVLEAVTDRIEEWAGDPSSRRVQAAERKADRAEKRQHLQEQFKEEEAHRATTKTIVDKILELVPENMDRKRQEAFYNDAIADVKRHIESNNGELRGNVMDIIEPRLELYGLTQNGKPSARPAARRAEPANKVGERFVARRRTKQAAATAPGGAGAVPANKRPPKGASLGEALSWLEANPG